METHSITTQRVAGGYTLLVAGPWRADLQEVFRGLPFLGVSARYDKKAMYWRIWLPYGGGVEFLRGELQVLQPLVAASDWSPVELAMDALEAGALKYLEASRNWGSRLPPLVRALQDAGRPLEDYQTMGAHLLGQKFFGLLNDEQGMGKTRTMGVLLCCLQMWPVVVVTRASCKYGWQEELHMVDPSLRVQVLDSGDEPDPQAQVYILSYNLMTRFTRITRQPLGVTIFDESQEMVNAKTEQGRRSRIFAYAAQRCYLVTGTPMPSRHRDLRHQLTLIRCPVAINGEIFNLRYCDGHEVERKDAETGGVKVVFDNRGVSNERELNEIVAALTLRRTKREFLQLPGKERIFRSFTLPVGHPYWDAHRDLRRARGDVAKLKAISVARAEAALGKVPFTSDIVQRNLDAGRKIVIFSCCIKAADALHRRFPKALRLSGSMTPLRRKIIQDKFQKDPLQRLIICAMKSSGAGINLQSASLAVFNDLPWSPDVTRQAEDRIHRIGSQADCQSIYVIARHSYDEVMQAVLNRKEKLQKAFEHWMEGATQRRAEQSMLFG